MVGSTTLIKAPSRRWVWSAVVATAAFLVGGSTPSLFAQTELPPEVEQLRTYGWDVVVTHPLKRWAPPIARKDRKRPDFFVLERGTNGLSRECAATVGVYINDSAGLKNLDIRSIEQFQAVLKELPRFSREDVTTMVPYLRDARTQEEIEDHSERWANAFPDKAAKLTPYQPYALAGAEATPDAQCINYARMRPRIGNDTGKCIGLKTENDFFLIYRFDPGLCQFNHAAGRPIRGFGCRRVGAGTRHRSSCKRARATRFSSRDPPTRRASLRLTSL